MSVAVASKPLAGQFVPPEVLSRVGLMSRTQADACDFGVVKVDDSGKILLYNRYEAELAGITPSTAEGRNFFTEVAPCTNNALFFGQFKKGIASGNLNLMFPYTFTYKMKPTNVKVHMFRDPDSKTNWVFVKKS
ncbi:MAG: PAS domain-containing protein [Tepidisphaerales bacterium]